MACMRFLPANKKNAGERLGFRSDNRNKKEFYQVLTGLLMAMLSKITKCSNSRKTNLPVARSSEAPANELIATNLA